MTMLRFGLVLLGATLAQASTTLLPPWVPKPPTMPHPVPADGLGRPPSTVPAPGQGSSCYFDGLWLGNTVLTIPSGSFKGCHEYCLNKQTKVYCVGTVTYYCCGAMCAGQNFTARPQACQLSAPAEANWIVPATCPNPLSAPGSCDVGCPAGQTPNPPLGNAITCMPSATGAVIDYPWSKICEDIIPPSDDCEKALAAANAQIDALESQAGFLNQQVAALNTEIQVTQSTCEVQCVIQLAKKDQEIADLQGELDSIRTTCEQQCTIIIAQKDDEIADLNQQIEQLTTDCQEGCEAIIAQKDREIALLQANVTSLNQEIQIKNETLQGLVQLNNFLTETNVDLQDENLKLRGTRGVLLYLLSLCKNCTGPDVGFDPVTKDCVPCSTLETSCLEDQIYEYIVANSTCTCRTMEPFYQAPIESSLDYILAGAVPPIVGPGDSKTDGWCFQKTVGTNSNSGSQKIFWGMGPAMPSLLNSSFPEVTGADLYSSWYIAEYISPIVASTGNNGSQTYFGYYKSAIASAATRTRAAQLAEQLVYPPGTYLVYYLNDPTNIAPGLPRIQATQTALENNFLTSKLAVTFLTNDSGNIGPAGSIQFCIKQSGQTFKKPSTNEFFGYQSTWVLPKEAYNSTWINY